MDLGLKNDTDFITPGNFSPEEIYALINPIRSTLREQQSAVQILLNQGAEYLAQKKPDIFENLMHLWHFDLSKKSPKIQSISLSPISTGTLQTPLFCPFNIDENTSGYLAFDWRVSYILIDGLLGGINGVSIEKKQEQPYSAIEKNILKPVFQSLITALSNEIKTPLTTQELSTHTPFENTPCTNFSFLIKTPTTTGKIYLKIPSSVIPKQVQQPLFPQDVLKEIPIEATALVGGFKATLSQVINWQVGTHLILGQDTQTTTAITVDDKIVAIGQIQIDSSNRQIVMEDIYDI